jgi:hypothetical protein
VRLAVCGSALGSVRKCAWQCVPVRLAVFGSPAVQQCAAVCDSVRQCATVCGSAAVGGSAEVCGSVAVCGSMAACGSDQ